MSLMARSVNNKEEKLVGFNHHLSALEHFSTDLELFSSLLQIIYPITSFVYKILFFNTFSRIFVPPLSTCICMNARYNLESVILVPCAAELHMIWSLFCRDRYLKFKTYILRLYYGICSSFNCILILQTTNWPFNIVLYIL